MTDEPPVTDGPVASTRPVPGRAPAAAVTRPIDGAASFEALFHREYVTMFRLAHLLGADDPEDVAQEAFARIHARWARLADRGSAGGYLRTTVVNLVRSRSERRTMAQRRMMSTDPPDSDVADSAESAALASIGDATILGALRELSPRHREALVLRFWLDLSERQIADAMGTSVGTAKSHVSRGLSALRSVLAGCGGM